MVATSTAYPRAELLVEPDWLAAHLNAPNVRVIDCDQAELVAARPHIQGAVALPIHPYFRDWETGVGVATAAQTEQIMRGLGVSNATREQVAEARALGTVVCVQNLYNLAHRDDDALVDELAAGGVAYVPFFPLGGFSPLQSTALSHVAERRGTTPMAVALAWLLQRSPTILVIPGSGDPAHVRDNVAAAALRLGPEDLAELSG